MPVQKNDIYLSQGDAVLYLLDPLGRTLTINTIELSRQDRTRSGRLVKDIIAVKHEIILDYTLMDIDTLEDYQTIYGYQTELTLDIQKDTVNYDRYTVLMDPISWERVIANTLYANVTIKFLEV